MLEALMAFLLLFAVMYYFFFGGKAKLSRYLFNRKSLAEKVETIMKNDFSPKFARAAFYIGNNYHHRMSQADWQKYCQERIDPSLDKNSQEYAEMVAPIVNAIALDAEGFYLRRGMEDLSRNLIRFQGGINDKISLNFFVEPYEYFENKELAAKSLAEEALRQKKFEEQYERERPIREAREAERKAAQQERQQRNRELDAAYARCRGCANSMKCRDSAKRVPGACGGYIPK